MRALIEMSHSKGCNEGPVYIHSFMLLARGCGFALASKTIRTLVVLAFSLTTGLCGMWKVWSPVGVSGATSTIPSSCSHTIVSYSSLSFRSRLNFFSTLIRRLLLGCSFVLDKELPGIQGTLTLYRPSSALVMLSMKLLYMSD